jgi:putative thiamine transport system ATP-binding protein
MSGLLLEDVRIAIGARPLFQPLSLHIPRGEAATLMGPSGCGKSSLLAFLCGTLDPALSAAGRVSLDGVPLDGLPPERRRVGILFQDDLLFPHLSVGGNLGFGLPPGLSRAERRARIEAALAEAELPGFAERDPATLSGGQRARVALMRALLAEPRALLLDEPFGRLDAALRARFRAFVLDHAAARGLPVLLVTHDPADAAGRVVHLAPDAEPVMP